MLLCLERMGPFIVCHALNDGPIHSIIYSVPLGAHGPIYIGLRLERMSPDISCYAQSIWAHFYSVTLYTIGPCSQCYILLRSECLGRCVICYALNDGPILLIINFVPLGAYGPICILSRIERWAHTLNYKFCSAQSVWAHSYYFTH
jgi:hypothetical protein